MLPEPKEGTMQKKGSAPVLAFENVCKIYTSGSGWRSVLNSVYFEVASGRSISVSGRSGSGKSTLLNLAAGIDLPTSGRVLVEGRDLSSLNERARTRLRRDRIGMVFQFFHLLSHLSVEENVVLPELIAGGRSRQFRPRAQELLERVGLADRCGDNIQKLSGGEMQRVAICRALLRRPRLILADEPTGSLDDESSAGVMELMLRLVREEGSTLIFVTHSPELASLADEALSIHSGVLEPAPAFAARSEVGSASLSPGEAHSL